MEQIPTLSLNRNGDCLNTIRLIAVIQVVFGHTTRWLKIPYSDMMDLFSAIFQGVPIFFMMSGFLVWFSIGRSKSFIEYVLKRFWRLYPELWVAVLFEIVVILMIYNHQIEWGKLVLFAVSEGTMPFWMPDFLRDYGTGKPNGALWTISCLIKFYIIGFFMYKWMKGRPLRIWIPFLLFLICFGHFSSFIKDNAPSKWVLLYNLSTLPFLWLFAMGAFIADRWNNGVLEFLKRYWPLAFITTIIVEFTGFDIDCSDPDYGYFLIKCISTLFWILGFAYAFPQLNVKTDISYALFLYHMTIIQIFYTYGYTQNFVYIIFVMIISAILSYLSTIYIGEWSKRKKQRLVSPSH